MTVPADTTTRILPPAGYDTCNTRGPHPDTQTVHLVRLDEHGSNQGRPTLCGLTRFDERDPETHEIIRLADLPGWGMGGSGIFGSRITQTPCMACWQPPQAQPDSTQSTLPIISPIQPGATVQQGAASNHEKDDGMTTVINLDAVTAVAEQPDASVEHTYIDIPFNTRRPQTGPSGGYIDRWADTDDFIDWLAPILTDIRRTLTDTGTVCVHCDWRTSHRVRCLLDRVYGDDLFVNHVVWCYSSGGGTPKRFSRKHDDLLIYAKTGEYTFNPQREPYATPGVDGRPGFHPDGRYMNDWWTIPILSTTASERTGWPNQKPVELVARLIRAFTNPGDVVADWFCGSGTTGVAATGLGRRAVLNDADPTAAAITRTRLTASQPTML